MSTNVPTSTKADKPAVSPVLVLGIGVLAASLSAILIRWAQAEAPSLVIAAWRLTLAAVVLLPLAVIRQKEELKALTAADWRLAFFAGGLLGIHFATWITSLEYTSVTSSTVLVTTNPMWVAIASPFVLKESISKPLKVGIVLALLGSLIITVGDALVMEGSSIIGFNWRGTDTQQPLWGNFLALLGAWAIAGYILIGRFLRPRLSLLSYTAVVYGTASLTLIIMVLISGQPFFGYTPYIYLLFALMAIFPQMVGHTSFNWALKFLPAAYVSITILGEPIGSTILAFIILQELPNIPLIALLGSLLIFIGIIAASRK
ncbi:MAG: DMT family transporter [Anaerolineales bacterium]|nr:DMT family transporter [Anaerolineales bacterium]